MVEVPGQGEDARAADAAVRGFHADDAAAESGPTDGAAGVSSHGAEGQTGSYRRPRAATRTAGINLQVPGVAGRLEVRRQRGRTSRELVRGQLPQQQPAGLLEFRHNPAVLLGHVILAQL